MRHRILSIGLLLIATAACAGISLPPISVAFPPHVPAPPVVEPPRPAEPPVVVTPPEPAPEVEEPPAAPLVNLNIVVHDAVTGAGIPRAVCTIADDSRSADGSGFINFAVPGPVVVRCAAGGYQARVPLSLPPGDHRVPLVPSAPPPPPSPAPEPPVTPAPPDGPLTRFPGCAPDQNTAAIANACLEAVATLRRPLDYAACQKGNPVACHRYVRAVARALADHVPTDGTWGWGLITKPKGQQACTMTACGRDVDGGYGEDMVAYLPRGSAPNRWTGLDIIVGAGAPGAHFAGGTLPPAVGGRADNLWTPVP